MAASRIRWYSLSVSVCTGDGDRVAGVDAHRVEVLDRADDDDVVVAVAHHLQLVLLPPDHALLDEHLGDRAGVEAALDDRLELLDVVGDAPARPPSVNAGRMIAGSPTTSSIAARASSSVCTTRLAGTLRPMPIIRSLKALAVLTLEDRLAVGPDHLHAVFLVKIPLS